VKQAVKKSMQPSNKNKLFQITFLLLFILLFCAPFTLKASVLDSAATLASSDILLAAGGLLTFIGLLRPFKRKVEQPEEE
jgi:predicted ABC-type sugar transport system permease subunit